MRIGSVKTSSKIRYKDLEEVKRQKEECERRKARQDSLKFKQITDLKNL